MRKGRGEGRGAAEDGGGRARRTCRGVYSLYSGGPGCLGEHGAPAGGDVVGCVGGVRCRGGARVTAGRCASRCAPLLQLATATIK